ncbi:MAG: methyltransferase domain-containing protein [Desulfurococcales archaeon]|nr:methyltransferase domain-containing protein [Desulfurococcales archaeon]
MSLKEMSLEEGKKNAWGILLIRREELKRFLSELFGRHKHLEILEIGCYKGFLVGWLRENFPKSKYSWNYYGVDIVELPDRRKDYPHYVMNAEALEFPSNSFDVVIAIEVIEHVVDYVRALREIYRVLRPGGGVFIQSVTCCDPCAIADTTHFHVLHPVTLKRLLEWLGFRDVQYVGGEDGKGNFAIWGYK